MNLVLADSSVHDLSCLFLGLPNLQTSMNTLYAYPCPPISVQKPQAHTHKPPSAQPSPSLSLLLPQHPSPGGGLAPPGSLPCTAPIPRGPPPSPRSPALLVWASPLGLLLSLIPGALVSLASWEEDHRGGPVQAGLPEGFNQGRHQALCIFAITVHSPHSCYRNSGLSDKGPWP